MSITQLTRTGLTALLLTGANAGFCNQTAGTVEFVSGPVTISSASGEKRQATPRSKIGSGETIETGDGSRAQLRMVDGAYLSLQPKSQLRLDDYALATGKTEESAFMNLVRGGFRTITGLIGKTNRDRYSVTTTTATIGIRGTEFAIEVNEGTHVNVVDGLVALCSTGGCIDIGAGQSGFAPPSKAKPALTFQAARLPPTSPSEAATPIQAEQRNNDGSSTFMATVPLPNGTGGLMMTSMTTGGSWAGGLLGGTLTFNSDGSLQSFIDCCLPTGNYTEGTTTDFGADGIIAWGRWSSGLGQGALPLATMTYAAVSNSNPVTVGSIVRGYATFASTAPIAVNGGSVVAVGVPNSVTGSMSVNFGDTCSGCNTGSLNYVLNVPIAGQTFTINGSASQYFGTAFLGSTSSISSSGTGCSGGCAGVVPFADAFQGIFAGKDAERAGGNYGFSSDIGKITGAVVLK